MRIPTKKSVESTLSGYVQRSSPEIFAKQLRDEVEAWKEQDIKPE